MSSDAALIDEVIAKILSGNRDTTAANLRETLIDFIDSKQNTDGRNQPAGYVGIDDSGFMDNELIQTRNPAIVHTLVITRITDASNWDGSGVYIGPDNALNFGDEYYDTVYWYRVMFDNTIIRLQRA